MNAFYRAVALAAALLLAGCSHSTDTKETRPQAWLLATYDETGIHTEQSIVVPQLPPASQVLADVMLSHWPISAWQPQLPKGWTLTDNGDRRELRNDSGKLVTEIVYLQRKGKREPISIEQHVFKYHITIQYLGD